HGPYQAAGPGGCHDAVNRRTAASTRVESAPSEQVLKYVRGRKMGNSARERSHAMTVSACARDERSTASPLQLFNRARQAREAAGHLVQRGFLFGVGKPDVAPSRLRVMEKTAPRDGGHTELFHQKLRERNIILTELADVQDSVVD